MIRINKQKNKSKKTTSVDSRWGKSFAEIRNMNIEGRERIANRQILGIAEFVAKSREKNPQYSWSHAPWPVQFLPVITEFFSEFGKISAVNPGLSGLSGLMGVSKSEINSRLNEDFRPKNLFLEKIPASRNKLEKIFQKKYSKLIRFPVIFKPSVGERSTGVNFVREGQIDNFLQENSELESIIFEEFISEEKEFGLSWMKNPQDHKISIFAFTERITPHVTGNGEKPLKELIDKRCQELSISDDRKEKIFAGFSSAELTEKITGPRQFVRTASISYGTILKRINLTPLLRKKLEKLVQNMIKNMDGLYVGRFDLKANSLEELVDGKCLIIEMNGVAGAPLDIYDDSISVSNKYKILFDYFSRVLGIAEFNIAKNIGQAVSKAEGLKNISKLLFGKNKTQELPPNVWEDLREVFKISLKGRLLASDLGKFIKNEED